ncbi:hypothetical protein SEA_KEELAN_30 [Gordonia phage Keelan]|nr:hypothetical protein SEA_KEELAN_30 [Gordonia phage Keelan]
MKGINMSTLTVDIDDHDKALELLLGLEDSSPAQRLISEQGAHGNVALASVGLLREEITDVVTTGMAQRISAYREKDDLVLRLECAEQVVIVYTIGLLDADDKQIPVSDDFERGFRLGAAAVLSTLNEVSDRVSDWPKVIRELQERYTGE